MPWVVNVSGSNVSFDESLTHETYQNLRQMGIPSLFDALMHPYAFAIAQRKRARWWELNGDYDPQDDWAQLNVPTLVIYGREDERDNVPVQDSIDRFNALGRDNIHIDVHENVGHGLFDRARRIVPAVLERVAEWPIRPQSISL